MDYITYVSAPVGVSSSRCKEKGGYLNVRESSAQFRKPPIYTKADRVKKLVGENGRFVYGLGGELVAEFDGSSGNLKKEYISGGISIEPTAVNANGTQYATGDHLGSPRVITNSGGSVVSRHDYMPFGEELGAGTGGRTTGMGFSNSGDNNRKKFTGYQRDTETGLDYAQARYYGNTQGRFTSPDPFSGSATIANPQTFNRYAYCGNNPVNSTDPSGLAAGGLLFNIHGANDSLDFSRGSTGSKSHASMNDDIGDAEASYEAMVQYHFSGQAALDAEITNAISASSEDLSWTTSVGIGNTPQNPVPISPEELARIRSDVEKAISAKKCADFLKALLNEAAVQSGQPYRDIMVTFDNTKFFYGGNGPYGGLASGSFENGTAKANLIQFEKNFISADRSSFIRTQTAQNALGETLHHVGTHEAYDDPTMANALNAIYVRQGKDTPKMFFGKTTAQVQSASIYWHPRVMDACSMKY